MRIVAWNLRHGGGSRRMAPIALTILEHRPDLLVLTEFRRTTGGQIAGVLADHGLMHQATTDPGKNRNGILVASRAPLHTAEGCSSAGAAALSRDAAPAGVLTRGTTDLPAALRHRWLDLCIPDFDLNLAAIHAPHDDPMSRSGPSTARAACFQRVVAAARRHAGIPFALVGDFNAGRHHVDEEGATFSLTAALGMIASVGYIDAWRYLNASGREYTWYSHTGSGFRIDHAFLSPPLSRRLRACRYSHDERVAGLSDHSILLLDLDGPAPMPDSDRNSGVFRPG